MTVRSLAHKAGLSTGAALGASALLVFGAVPSQAQGLELEGGTAVAGAVQLQVGDQVVTDHLTAVMESGKQVLSGLPDPVSPALAGTDLVQVGVLGQDAFAGDYEAAACAGLVGPGGTIEVGSEGGCLTRSDGRVEISLGTLPELGVESLLTELEGLTGGLTGGETGGLLGGLGGLEELLGGLPLLSELPTGSLPDVRLSIVGDAFTSSCVVNGLDASASTEAADAQLVAAIGDSEIVVADITAEGLTLDHATLLTLLNDKLDTLPGTVKDVLGQVTTLVERVQSELPAGEVLPTGELVSVNVDQRVEADGFAMANALSVQLNAPALPDLESLTSLGGGLSGIGSGTLPFALPLDILPLDLLPLDALPLDLLPLDALEQVTAGELPGLGGGELPLGGGLPLSGLSEGVSLSVGSVACAAPAYNTGPEREGTPVVTDGSGEKSEDSGSTDTGGDDAEAADAGESASDGEKVADAGADSAEAGDAPGELNAESTSASGPMGMGWGTSALIVLGTLVLATLALGARRRLLPTHRKH